MARITITIRVTWNKSILAWTKYNRWQLDPIPLPSSQLRQAWTSCASKFPSELISNNNIYFPTLTAPSRTFSNVSKGSWKNVLPLCKEKFTNSPSSISLELYASSVTKARNEKVSCSIETSELTSNTMVFAVFLQSSPCIHDKVLSTSAYKSNCNTNYLAALDYVGNRTNIDERIESLCCGHNTWEDCTKEMVTDSCGAHSQERFKQFLDRTFGGVSNVLCPTNIFPSTGKICKQSLPPRGSKPRGKVSDNIIGKYLNSYLSFIFNNF